MPAALTPRNWLDWAILVYVLLGFWQGLRRGLVLSVVGIAATVLAVVVAGQYGPRAVQAANAHWHTEQHLEQYLSRQMPLPDGSGQVPYSTAAAAVLRQDIGRGLTGPAGTAVANVFQAPPPSPKPATLQGYFDAVVASHVMGLLAFLALLIGGEVVFHFLGGLVFGRIARRGVAGVLNGGLGAVFAAAARLVEATAVLALMAALAAVPATAALEAVLHGSRWAAPLLSAFHAVLPETGKWVNWLA